MSKRVKETERERTCECSKRCMSLEHVLFDTGGFGANPKGVFESVGG